MREILFRGKRIDNGEWAYSQTVFSHLDNFYIPTQNLKCTVMRNLDTVGNISEIRCKDGKCFFKVHPETVGQFTGLTDKNGKKIFEGDIISVPGSKQLGLPGIVIFHQLDAKYILFRQRYSYLNLINVNEWGYIIGNIHDNSDLLGGEKNEIQN